MLACYAIVIGVATNGFLQLKTYFSYNFLIMIEEYNDNYNFWKEQKRLFPELDEAYHSVSVIQFDKDGFTTERAQLL